MMFRTICLAVCMFLMVPAAFSDSPKVSDSAFPIRGMKGLYWEGIEKYMDAAPWLGRHGMNFLMLCYTSFPESAREWRQPYTPQHMDDMQRLVTLAADNGVTVCLSFNPGIWSRPPLCHACEEDYQHSLTKVKQVQAIGINWIALCLDDIATNLRPEDEAKYGTLARAHVDYVNRLWKDMQALSPEMRLVFCPSPYTTGEMGKYPDYVREMAEGLSPDIPVFWTGVDVVSKAVTKADAEEAKRQYKREIWLWDNYPVNDMYPWQPLLAPIQGRAPDLSEAIDAVVVNPMKQWEASKLPMLSFAKYLRDPAGYSVEGEVDRMVAAYPERAQGAIRELINFYGSSFVGEQHYPPRPRALSAPEAAELLPRLQKVKQVLSNDPELRPLWEDVKETVEEDLAEVQAYASGRRLMGREFKGGAPEVGRHAFGTGAALVYAEITGKHEARGEFQVADVPASATLRLHGRNSDTGEVASISIKLNGKTLMEGKQRFARDRFSDLDLAVPPNYLQKGTNELTVTNLEREGTVGMPPWFALRSMDLILE